MSHPRAESYASLTIGNQERFHSPNDPYSLPNGESERSRLDKQHAALVSGMGGLTPCQATVDAILMPESGKDKRVLDIGCGTGIWATHMARTYPHVSVVGVDLSPASLDLSTLPINLKFEIEDLNHGLSRFHSEFDVVHMRCVSGGILDFEKAMESVQRCAKPGGLVLFIDGEAKMYAEDQLHPAKIPEETARNGSEEGSWFAKVIRDACKANQIAGADIARAGELIDFGLWNSPFCDPTTAYSGCVYIPIGPWPQVPDPAQFRQLECAGMLMREAFLNLHRAYHGVLLKHGITQDTLDQWAIKVDDELKGIKNKLWTRFRFCWARRRATDYTELPLTTADIAPSKECKLQQYPYLFTFTSAEEAALDAQQRKDAAETFKIEK